MSETEPTIPSPTPSDLRLVDETVLTCSPSIFATFDPQPDITAYELARLLPWLVGPHYRPFCESDWQALGAATRHLKRNS